MQAALIFLSYHLEASFLIIGKRENGTIALAMKCFLALSWEGHVSLAMS